MALDISASLATFNSTKLYIHSQRDEFFRRGVNVRSNTVLDETKSEDGRTTRVIDPSMVDVNPLELNADIAHFKEHFSNMKWMYLEQETKEAYLRAILCDPPEVIEQKDNDELEARNAAAKAKLKAKKREVDELCAEVTDLVKDVADDYMDLSNKSVEASRLLSEISEMQAAINELKNAQEQGNTDQNLPLPESIALLDSLNTKRDQLAIAVERQSQENARKRKEVEKLSAQLAEMERDRIDAELFARQAERSKNAENMQEEMACKKQVGWWLKAMTTVQMELLGLKEFKVDEQGREVNLVLEVDRKDIPVQIYLKNGQFESAKVAYKGLRLNDVIAETKKRGGDIPFFLELLKLEISSKSTR